MRTKKSKRETFQHYVDEYRAEGNQWPASSTTLAQWMLRTRRAKFSKRSQVEMLAREVSEALREKFFTDPQMRRVRKLHCYPEWTDSPSGLKKQQFLWCDIESATPDQFRASVSHRRRQMVNDAKQLKTDVDSFNENNAHGAEVQLSLDLTFDVVESQLDTEYNPPKDEGSESDSEPDQQT